jgi:hypothetical protein
MSRLVSNCDFFSQALGTGTVRNLLQFGNKLPLEHSKLFVFLICIEKVLLSVYRYKVKIKLSL